MTDREVIDALVEALELAEALLCDGPRAEFLDEAAVIDMARRALALAQGEGKGVTNG